MACIWGRHLRPAFFFLLNLAGPLELSTSTLFLAPTETCPSRQSKCLDPLDDSAPCIGSQASCSRPSPTQQSSPKLEPLGLPNPGCRSYLPAESCRDPCSRDSTPPHSRLHLEACCAAPWMAELCALGRATEQH